MRTGRRRFTVMVAMSLREAFAGSAEATAENAPGVRALANVSSVASRRNRVYLVVVTAETVLDASRTSWSGAAQQGDCESLW